MPAKSSPAKKAAKAAVKKSAPKKEVAAAKKSAPKKAAKDKYDIKYSDKSKGQPKELVEIWEAIRDMMLPYEKGDMKIQGGSGGQVALINHKPVEIKGKMRDELWFAGALIQKGYVGYYFNPEYATGNGGREIAPELMKCLKGKSCFHIKKADPVLLKQIKESLKLGFEAYRKNGLI